jgi:hypothetical protein
VANCCANPRCHRVFTFPFDSAAWPSLCPDCAREALGAARAAGGGVAVVADKPAAVVTTDGRTVEGVSGTWPARLAARPVILPAGPKWTAGHGEPIPETLTVPLDAIRRANAAPECLPLLPPDDEAPTLDARPGCDATVTVRKTDPVPWTGGRELFGLEMDVSTGLLALDLAYIARHFPERCPVVIPLGGEGGRVDGYEQVKRGGLVKVTVEPAAEPGAPGTLRPWREGDDPRQTLYALCLE